MPNKGYNYPRSEYPRQPYSYSQATQPNPDTYSTNYSEIKKFRCQSHPNEYITKLCIYPVCSRFSLFCDMCVLDKKKTCLYEHHEYIQTVEDYLDVMMQFFQTHRMDLKKQKTIPEDILEFLESEARNTRRYTDHIRQQKKQLDENIGALIKSFISLVQMKCNEIKTTMDLQYRVYQTNYNFLIEKTLELYDHVGIRAFSPPFCGDKDYLYSFIRRLREANDLDMLVQEMKQNVLNVEHFKESTDKPRPKRNHDDEVLAELRRCFSKLDMQGKNPMSLNDFSADEESKKGFNTNINFFQAYRSLMKDLERVIDNFEKKLKGVHKNEEMYPSNSDSMRNENDFIHKENVNPLRSHNNSYRFLPQNYLEDRKTSHWYTPTVTADNYFNLDSKHKLLSFFEPSTNLIYLADIQESLTAQSVGFQSDELLNIQSYKLDNDWVIPYNFCSIITPCGKIFLTGGCESGTVFNTTWEVEFGRASTPLKMMSRSSMNMTRCNHGICMLDDENIFVAGGYTKEKCSTDTCEIYNIREDKWKFCTPMFSSSENMSLCNFKGEYIYRIGGKNDRTIDKYIIKRNKWEKIPLKLPDIGINIESFQITAQEIMIFGGNSTDCIFLNIDDSDGITQETLIADSPLQLPEKVYFHCPKMVITNQKQLFAMDHGRQRVLVYKNHTWSYLN